MRGVMSDIQDKSQETYKEAGSVHGARERQPKGIHPFPCDCASHKQGIGSDTDSNPSPPAVGTGVTS